MDAASSVTADRERNAFSSNPLLPWDAPEAVVNVSSAGVVIGEICQMVWDWWVVKKTRQGVVSCRAETLVVFACLFRMGEGPTRIFMM